MYCYNVYGLTIHSLFPLPGLVASVENRKDVIIQSGKVNIQPRSINTQEVPYGVYHLNGDDLYFIWDNVGKYYLKGGKLIIVEPDAGVEEWRACLPIVGLAFPLLLYQRGLLALHGSALEINGVTVAFLGGKGWGKSTLASALYERGHNLIDDDVVALDVSNTNNPKVYPGFPQFKLWPDSVFHIGKDPETLPRFHPKYDKRLLQANDKFSNKSHVLKQIYVLSKGSSLEIKPLQPREIMVQLIGNSYIARVAKQFVKGEVAAALLDQCASVARNVPIYWLKRPNSLNLLPCLAQYIEEHISSDLH